MMFKRGLLLTGLLVLSACSQTPSPAEGVGLSPERLGTAAYDSVADIAADQTRGAVYAVGSTTGSLDGPNRGGSDVFLRRYSRSGAVVWRRQLGGAPQDTAFGVAVSPDGPVYVGYTQTGGPDDGLLQKFSADGARLWTRRLSLGDRPTSVTSVATDPSGNVYAGGTGGENGIEAFIRKYSSSGAVLWTYQYTGFGILHEVEALSTDSAGNVYAGGGDYDDWGFTNFLIKLSPDGEPLFEDQLATPSGSISVQDVQVAENALYVVGYKVYNEERPDLRTSDAFIGKYTLGGGAQWQKTFGTSSTDNALGLATDASGGLYVTGTTCGALGSIDPGGCDIFLRKYSGGGAALWTRQIGSSGYDYGSAVAAYGGSELYLVGEVGGALADTTHRGGQDGFLRRTDGQGNRVWTDQ